MSERMTKEERVRAAVVVRQAMLGERTMPDDAHAALTAILNESDAARAEEARLLELVKKQEERIVALEAAVSAVMGSMTTFGSRDVTVIMRREEYAKVLEPKVSP